MSVPMIEDKIAAEAFRTLLAHLQHRTDVQNVDLMGLAGFCRNCLADWVSEASDHSLDRETARYAIYGMPYHDWKSQHQKEASAVQLERMAESMTRNK